MSVGVSVTGGLGQWTRDLSVLKRPEKCDIVEALARPFLGFTPRAPLSSIYTAFFSFNTAIKSHALVTRKNRCVTFFVSSQNAKVSSPCPRPPVTETPRHRVRDTFRVCSKR